MKAKGKKRNCSCRFSLTDVRGSYVGKELYGGESLATEEDDVGRVETRGQW